MQIIPFEYESKQVRIVQDENGDPWWVAKDVCQALELRDTGRAIQSLDKDESKTFRVTDRLGREQESYIISEPGLYRLLSRSTKDEAKKFQRWLFHKVLPSIRKTGKYEIEGLSEIDLIIKSAQALKHIELKTLEHDRRLTTLEALSKTDSGDTGYMTIIGWCNLHKIRLPREEAAAKGLLATEISKQRGIPIYRAKDERYGQVNKYREDILEEAFYAHA